MDKSLEIIQDSFKNYDIDTPCLTLKGISCYARCVNIYDGDTCTLIIPFLGKHFRFSCRLYGIDTSEIRSADESCKVKAYSARNRLLELVTGMKINEVSKKDIVRMLAEKVYVVWIECLENDKYGRVLVKISKEEKSECFSNILINEKLAYPYFGSTKLSEQHQLEYNKEKTETQP